MKRAKRLTRNERIRASGRSKWTNAPHGGPTRDVRREFRGSSRGGISVPREPSRHPARIRAIAERQRIADEVERRKQQCALAAKLDGART